MSRVSVQEDGKAWSWMAGRGTQHDNLTPLSCVLTMVKMVNVTIQTCHME